MISRRGFVGLALAAGGLAAAGTAGSAFASDMALSRAKIVGFSGKLIETPAGPMSYAEAGRGAPVLMIHGTGGGFDQGLFMSRRLVDLGYRVIAPSRFGYLGSAMPADRSSGHQADAFAALLDHLGLERVAVAGGSAGALSALAFAVRHPARTAALLPLVPAGRVPGEPEPRPWSAAQRLLAERALRSDLVFWTALRLAPDQMVRTLLASEPALLDTASAEEAERVREIAWRILPVSERAEGMLNDARLTALPLPEGLERITAPTLSISLEDDMFGTAAVARAITERVRGAELVVYPSGGHVWIGRDRELFTAVDGFLKARGYA